MVWVLGIGMVLLLGPAILLGWGKAKRKLDRYEKSWRMEHRVGKSEDVQ